MMILDVSIICDIPSEMTLNTDWMGKVKNIEDIVTQLQSYLAKDV